MVGVPGKYKGCETCRRRRVKCTNERPYCHKCISTGRQCEGYEREMVFITGTPENKGRVASHPRKGTPSVPSSTSSRSPRPSTEPETTMATTTARPDRYPDLIPTQPLTPAWDDYIALARDGRECRTLLTALHVPLEGVIRETIDNNPEGERFSIALPPYTPLDISSNMIAGDPAIRGHCLVQVSPSNGTEGSCDDSFCVFLFEVATTLGPEDATSVLRPSDAVSSLGPSHFRAFPYHYFFARVYRPLKLSFALLHRKDTIVTDSAWTTIPWEWHPKSPLDHLLDIVSQLPRVFEQTDRLLPYQATLARRQEAQDLMMLCIGIESQLEHWLSMLSNQRTPDKPMSYWVEEMTTPSSAIPFSYSFMFSDNMTGIMFLYYWMALILLHKYTESLHRIIFQPVMDAYPNLWPDLPPALQVDITRYQQTRDLAANICRSLDSTLEGTTQPDILVAPMTVALDVYRELNTTSSQDGLLEMMWLEAFKGRLVEKGQYVATVLQGNQWAEIAKF